MPVAFGDASGLLGADENVGVIGMDEAGVR